MGAAGFFGLDSLTWKDIGRLGEGGLGKVFEER